MSTRRSSCRIEAANSTSQTTDEAAKDIDMLTGRGLVLDHCGHHEKIDKGSATYIEWYCTALRYLSHAPSGKRLTVNFDDSDLLYADLNVYELINAYAFGQIYGCKKMRDTALQAVKDWHILHQVIPGLPATHLCYKITARDSELQKLFVDLHVRYARIELFDEREEWPEEHLKTVIKHLISSQGADGIDADAFPPPTVFGGTYEQDQEIPNVPAELKSAYEVARVQTSKFRLQHELCQTRREYSRMGALSAKSSLAMAAFQDDIAVEMAAIRGCCQAVAQEARL